MGDFQGYSFSETLIKSFKMSNLWTPTVGTILTNILYILLLCLLLGNESLKHSKFFSCLNYKKKSTLFYNLENIKRFNTCLNWQRLNFTDKKNVTRRWYSYCTFWINWLCTCVNTKITICQFVHPPSKIKKITIWQYFKHY